MVGLVQIPVLPLAGVMFAFGESNLAGRVIVGLLFLGSILVWSLMSAKGRELSVARSKSRVFLRAYRSADHPLSLYTDAASTHEGPLADVYSRTCETAAAACAREGLGDDIATSLSRVEIKGLQTGAECAVADGVLKLESHMGLLATATTTAPFLGLLGTVWGVMDAFSRMTVTGANMLSAVAPGISGALLTTVIGLLVALPSAIGYNLLSDRIRRLSVETENFSQELVSDLERAFSGKEG